MTIQLQIVSSNIRFASPGDGENCWENRRQMLTDTINSFGPSLVGTQEGRKDQLYDFARLLPRLKLIDSHRNWMEERMYPCLLVDNKMFQVLESGDFWLSKTPNIPGSKDFGSAFPRLCTWAKLQTADKEIFVFNTHLDHLQSDTRFEQSKVLIDQISKLTKNFQFPVLLTGDFNEGPGEPVHELLMADHFKDPWQILNNPEETSYHKFEKDFQNGKRIDWILMSSEFSADSIQLEKSHKFPIFPSDHFPVKANLRI